MKGTYPNDSIVSGKVKGGGVRVRIRGSIDEGEIISTDERFDFKISKYFPVCFYSVKLDNGNIIEFIRTDLQWI